MEHVDLSTGMTWHPAETKKRKHASASAAMPSSSSSPSLTNFAFQCAFDQTQAAVNSVLQKANHACFDQVLDSFVERSSSSVDPHLLPLQPFPVAAVIAGTDAGAASSALWTEPLIRRLKYRFPFVVSVQRQFTNGRQLLEYVANAVFVEAQNRTMEGQWLQIELQRQKKQLTSRRSYRLPAARSSDVPVMKWDTVAAILRRVHDVVEPVMQQSDDVTIQTEMLHLELQSAADVAIAECQAKFDASCECLDRLLQDSTDRLQYLRKLVGVGTGTERKLMQLHQWLVDKYRNVVEHELKLEIHDAARLKLRRILRKIVTTHSIDKSVAAPEMLQDGAAAPLCVPTVILVVDQFESIDEIVFGDFLHMWRDHTTTTSAASSPMLLRLGLVLGFSSPFSPSYRRMPHAIASMVSVRPIVLEDSFKNFHDICQTLVLSGTFPITVSGAVFLWLHTTFSQTHSIDGFLAALKLILYQHVAPTWASRTTSVLDRHRVLALFPLPKDAAAAHGLPSTVQSYVQSLSDAESSALEHALRRQNHEGVSCDGGDDGSAEAVVAATLDRVHQWKQLWQCMWNCVDMTWHMCTTFEPSWTKLKATAVALALDGHLAGSVVAQHMQAFLLHHVGIRAMHSLVLEWRQCIARFEMDGCDAPALTEVASAIHDMVEVLAFVQETSESDETAKMIPEVRRDVWSLLSRRMLPCLSPALPAACAPLGCVFYFDDVEVLETHLASHMETAMAAAMEAKHPPGSFGHDLHILHTFYRHTAGMWISVAEWLEDFQTKCSGGAAPSKTTKDASKVRFLRGVAAMQHLGFVRQVGNGDDYVEKMLFL
ncbi:hypothetical protein H310_11558 [Aphanomyces invadans]|uniref:Origin recognition complex subunit 3 N-terminal domain-containing protein n=1 Tax=Aphanomyces invadans TaxID=157072 RepID=A0A024TNN0_9STRA|nr:hypothetical protein H310_11558 [Aphanomyces invadans]ETV94912.1 hypothetical protein H310_11558 [Aphanomyces invadans]|eukprot:XP_008876503.1 hypothetical protein H310_11558 [Aphanomyces invadans]